MSTVEDVHKIDAISVDKESNDVILNIFDHLDWSNEKMHIHLLQEKITNYLKFVESKEIENVFPDAKGKKIKICVVAKFSLTGNALKFIASVTQTVTSAGLSLDHSFFKKLRTE
ncbi:MAG: hypothetical protein H7256_08790 [Bdellovibrio sp.]|nr:hypothetical protein [Bdellovibrio sp.]